jgi:hypothetical protein
LIALVGFGISKTKIVIAKFILMALAGIIIFYLAPVYHYFVYVVNGCAAKIDVLPDIYIISLKYFLLTLAYAAIAGSAVYGLQKKTFATVLYILLASGIIGGLITAAAFIIAKDNASDYTAHLISNITNRILLGINGKDSLIMPVIEYIAYLLIAAGMSILTFRQKEMEF